MIKNILGCDFKYENDKLYRKLKSKWNCCNNNKPSTHGYITIGMNKKLYRLHRIIYKYHNDDWDLSDNSHSNQIDHVNINQLDNRIENLRVVNQSQNNINQNKKKNCSSKFKGVSWNKQNNKWEARFRRKYLGLFNSEEEAIETYKKKYNEIIK